MGQDIAEVLSFGSFYGMPWKEQQLDIVNAYYVFTSGLRLARYVNLSLYIL
jgi:hypothetical protein